MKTSKLLLTSLLAAATLISVPAFGSGEIISINFGKKDTANVVDGTEDGTAGLATISGSDTGVSAGGWTNASGQNGTVSTLKNHDGETIAGASVAWTCGNAAWGPNNWDTTTLLGTIQSSYLDLSADNTWNISVDTPFLVCDVYLYFSGDGSKYSPVNVNGTSYIGGTNVLAGDTTEWGDRGQNASGTLTLGTNTILVTGTAGIVSLSNVPQNDSAKRATISGMQIVNSYAGTAHAATLGGDSAWSGVSFDTAWANSQSTVDAETGQITSTNGAYADFMLTADTTLTFDSAVVTDAIYVSGEGKTLTLSNAGSGFLTLSGPATLRANAGATLAFDTTQISRAEGVSSVTLAGAGTIAFTDADGAAAYRRIGTDFTASSNSTVKILGNANFGTDALSVSSGIREFAGGLTAGAVTVSGGTLNITGSATLGGATLTGGKLAVAADANVSVSGTVEMGTATLDGGTAGITAVTLKFGYGGGGNTATIQGKVNVTGNLQESSSGAANGEAISLAEGASLSVGGTFGTTSSNAADWGQHSYVVNVGAGASFSAGTIAHGDSLTVNIGGDNAAVSATTLVLNSVWGNKTHAFTGQGAGVSTLSVGTINLKNEPNKTTTFSVSNARLEVGAGGITGNSSTPVFLSDVTLGVRDGADSWSSDLSMTLAGTMGADVGEGKEITLSGTLSVNGLIEKIGAGTLELAGTVNVGEGGSITVSAGTLTSSGTFNLTSAGTLNGTISATGGTLNLAGKLNLTSAINVTDGVSVTVSNSVAFVLSDAVKSGSEWILISGASSIDDWNTDTLSIGNFRKEDGTHFSGRGSISIGGVGKVSVTEGQSANLVWSGELDSNWNTTTRNWTNEGQADSFYVADNVTFDKDATVAVDAAGVVAGKVTIASEKTVTLSGGNVAAESGFELQTEATLSLGAGSANGATATLAGNSRYIVSATTGAFDFSNVSGIGSLVFRPTVSNPGYDGRTKVSLSENFTGDFVLDSEVWLSFAADHSTFGNATIVLSGDALFHSTKDVNLANNIRFDGSAAIWTDNANATVTLSGDVTGSSGTLNRRGGGAMIFSKSVSVGTFNQEVGATTVTGTANLTNVTVSIDPQKGSSSLKFSGSSTEIGTLTQTAGTTEFSGAGTLSVGTLNLNGGTLKVTNGAVLDLTNNSAREGIGTSAGSGATLEIDGAGSTVKISNGAWNAKSSLGMTYANTQVALSNGGVFEVTQAQSAEDSAGAAKRGFSISGGEGTYRYSGTGTSYIADNSSDADNQHIGLANTATLIFDVQQDTATLEVSKVIAATAAGASTETTGALKKIGAGTLTLTNANLYSGGTTISVGRLVAASASALGSGKTTVAADAKLGLVAGTTVTVTNGIDLKSGAKIVVDLSSKASATETFTLDLVSETALRYNEESITSANANILLGALELDGWNQSGWTQSLAYIEGSNTLRLTMTIPEPSVFGLLAGLGALALAGTRRRRKKA